MTAFNPIEAARLAEEFAEDSGGFNGEFCFVEAHTEDHGIGNIGDFVKVDDALAYLSWFGAVGPTHPKEPTNG